MQSDNDICPVYTLLQNNFFYHKILQKNVAWKLVSGPF